MKILIIDDSKAMRSLVRRAVTQALGAGHELAEAANGAEGLAELERSRPDLILSDWNMPEMSGLDLLRQLRQAGDPVRFGFITSESSAEIRELARAEGAHFLLSKPFTADKMRDAIVGVAS